MAMDARLRDVGELKTVPLFDMVVDLNPRLNIGAGPYGRRVFFGAAKGSFEGPRLRGEVLPGGGDWGLYRPDGGLTLDVRLTLRTHDDALVHMTYGGRWITPAALRADMADPAKRYKVDPASLLFPHQSALRNRRAAICLAQRHGVHWQRLSDRRRGRLQSLRNCVNAEDPKMSPARADPTLDYVEANGVRFAYLEQGHGPLVIFLHGFLTMHGHTSGS